MIDDPLLWVKAYLDCSFMFVQMRAMRVACTFRSNPALVRAERRSLPICSR